MVADKVVDQVIKVGSLEPIKKVARYFWSYENKVRPICPSGTGIIPIFSTIRDEKTGYIVRVKSGETNLQEKMNVEAKSVNLQALLDEVKNGTRQVAPLVYGDENKAPKDIYKANEFIRKVADEWDNNLLLKTMYPTKDDLKKDIANKVDIEKKMNTFVDKMKSSIQSVEAGKVENKGVEKADNKELK